MMTIQTPPVPTLSEDVAVIDSHCHLDMDDYAGDLDAVIDRAARHGVRGIVTIGTDLDSSRAAAAIAGRYPQVRAAVGVHPHEADSASPQTLADLAELAAGAPGVVVGYGEIGLDYVKQYSPPERQRQAFRAQLGLARELRLPVIIHDREAHQDCLQILDEEGPFDHGGVMHCFSGDLEFARRVIDRNFHVSIPGIVTYKNAETMQQVARHLPAERLLVETDGPYLAPVPCRGRRNEPLYTLYTVARIAELRATGPEEIGRLTTANCCRLFNCRFDC